MSQRTLAAAILILTAAGPAPTIPPDQSAMIAAAEQGRAAYASAANDMAKGAARPARAKAFCAALKSMTVKDWVGTVETLSSNGDGLGVLEVRVSPILTLKTWNNSLSDTGDRTLIQPGTPLFNTAAALKPGASVRFSGTFIRSATDCVREVSVTLRGSMEDPEVIFRFTAIKPE